MGYLETAGQFAFLDRKRQLLMGHSKEFLILLEDYLSVPSLEFELAKGAQFSSVDPTIERQGLEAQFRHLFSLKKKDQEVGCHDLLDLHRHLESSNTDPIRRHLVSPVCSTHSPLAPPFILSALERFFEWVHCDAFAEMHPIQQMTLSQMRLYEIYPFQHFSDHTVCLFSYHFLLTNDYLTPFYRLREVAKFRESLAKALVFSTEELVILNARACERSYDVILKKMGKSD